MTVLFSVDSDVCVCVCPDTGCGPCTLEYLRSAHPGMRETVTDYSRAQVTRLISDGVVQLELHTYCTVLHLQTVNRIRIQILKFFHTFIFVLRCFLFGSEVAQLF